MLSRRAMIVFILLMRICSLFWMLPPLQTLECPQFRDGHARSNPPVRDPCVSPIAIHARASAEQPPLSIKSGYTER